MGNSHVAAVIEYMNFSDLLAGDTVFSGERAENIARPDFLLSATINLQSRHGGFVAWFFQQAERGHQRVHQPGVG